MEDTSTAYKVWEFLQAQEKPREACYIADALKLDGLETVAALERLFVCEKARKIVVVGSTGKEGLTELSRVYWASVKAAFRLIDQWEFENALDGAFKD